MSTTVIRTDETAALERIESAMREHASCSLCGEYTTVVVRDAAVHVECAAIAPKHGLRYRLGAALHDTLRIDLPETRAAA